MSPRYAVYYAPATDDPLWTFGSHVLGYDAARRAEVTSMPPDGFSPDAWRDATSEPRRYGFHATLKAPFELATGCSANDLSAAIAAVAGQLRPLPLDLDVGRIGRFIALVPSTVPPGLADWAFTIVTALEPFRAPLSSADRARRLKGGALSSRQIALLDAYGYPYVAEEFRFHMTLSGPLDAADGARASAALRLRFRTEVPVGSRKLDRLVLFRQETREDRFHVVDTFTLR